MKDIRCIFGCHNWTWKLSSDVDMDCEVIYLNKPPPDHATCSRCGIRYKNE